MVLMQTNPFRGLFEGVGPENQDIFGPGLVFLLLLVSLLLLTSLLLLGCHKLVSDCMAHGHFQG